MSFNSAPASKLFVKVYANKRPYSKEVLNYSLIASDVSVFKANKALYTLLLPESAVTELELINFYCEQLRKRYNYAEFVLVSED